MTQGLEAIAALRRRSAALRIIVCSFRGDPATKALAQDVGADAYLNKPVSLASLKTAFREFFPDARTHPRPAAPGRAPAGRTLRAVDWAKQGDVLPPASADDLDSLRAWEPSVVEEDDGTLRMWYSGHDGTTGRILEAVQPPGRPWQRVGVSIEPSLAGDSDRYGVGSPCVAKIGGDYLMVYGGFDGEANTLHLATSPDGHSWKAGGPIVPGESRPLAGRTPSLLIGADQWWLFCRLHRARARRRSGDLHRGHGRRGPRDQRCQRFERRQRLRGPAAGGDPGRRLSAGRPLGSDRVRPRARAGRSRQPPLRGRTLPHLLPVLRQRERAAVEHRPGHLPRRRRVGDDAASSCPAPTTTPTPGP